MSFRRLLIINAFGFCLSACQQDENSTPPVLPDFTNEIECLVKALPYHNTLFSKELICYGKVAAEEQLTLQFLISGELETVRKRNGDIVFIGDTLASLVNQQELLQLELTKVSLEKKKASYNVLKIEFNLDDTISSDLDKARLKTIALESDLPTSELQVKQCMNDLRKTYIIAKKNGILGNVIHKVGEYIGVGEPFGLILPNDRFIVDAQIDEQYFNLIKQCKDFEIVNTANNKTLTGLLLNVDPVVHFGLIHFSLQAVRSNDILYGSYVKVAAILPQPNLQSIPKHAVVFRNNRSAVFTISEGRAVWNDVVVLDENADSYGITPIVKDGELIIVDGNTDIMHHAKIKCID